MKREQPRPLWLSMGLICATIAAGLIVRFTKLGLPPFVVKYGGSVLWAGMLYWLVSMLAGSWHVLRSALVACGIATFIECAKLYHTPGLDAFRYTLPGVLLLGRIFSVWDIAAYWTAIGVVAAFDRRLRAWR